MRDRLAGMLIGASLLILGGVWFASNSANALPPGNGLITAPGGIVCPPLNLPARALTIGSGCSAIKAEVESPTAVYFCGANAADGGILASGAATACSTRCNGASCPLGGGVYSVDVKTGSPPQVWCWSQNAGNDAGVVIKADCLR